MASQIRKVMIVGAGGHLGSFLLSAFRADARFTVSVLSRASSKSTFQGVNVYKVADDYPADEIVAAFQGHDAVISATGNTSILQQKVLIDAAIKAGVKRFVPSDFGSDLENEKAKAAFPMFFVNKQEVLDYLKEREHFISWTAFATGYVFETAVKDGGMGFDIKNRKAVVLDDGNTPWSTTTSSTIGLAVKNAMIAEMVNKYLYVTSFTVSQNQIIASLEKAFGKFEVEHVGAAEQRQAGEDKIEKGDYSGAMNLLQYINCVEGHGANFEDLGLANDQLSLPKEDLDKVVASFVE